MGACDWFACSSPHFTRHSQFHKILIMYKSAQFDVTHISFNSLFFAIVAATLLLSVLPYIVGEGGFCCCCAVALAADFFLCRLCCVNCIYYLILTAVV